MRREPVHVLVSTPLEWGPSLCENSHSQVCLEQLLIAIKQVQCQATRDKSIPQLFSKSCIKPTFLFPAQDYVLCLAMQNNLSQPGSTMRVHRDIFGGWESLLESMPNTNGFSQQGNLVPLISGASTFPSLHCWCLAQQRVFFCEKYLEGVLMSFLCCSLC